MKNIIKEIHDNPNFHFLGFRFTRKSEKVEYKLVQKLNTSEFFAFTETFQDFNPYSSRIVDLLLKKKTLKIGFKGYFLAFILNPLIKLYNWLPKFFKFIFNFR
jgi:hypothetical protein